MKKQRLIGLFDSGVGGLTVMKQIMEQVENVRILYFGDTARVPYGNRTQEELINFGEEIAAFLISQGAEVIVVACNTSSATSLPYLKEKFQIPIIGMIEPGAAMAVEKTTTGRIGLIGTEATVRSRAYNVAVSSALSKGILPLNIQARKAWQNGDQPISVVQAQACPLFVPLIEAGLSDSAETRKIAQTYLEPLLRAEIDSLILGCTHYPFLNNVLRELLGDNICLVDPALAVVEELKKVLNRLNQNEDEDLQSESQKNLWRTRYFVSGNPELFRQVGNTLLNESIDDIEKVALTP